MKEKKSDIQILQLKMKDQLTEKRYIHTLGVSMTAACLAMRYNADIQDAQIAGLLHDCAKCMSDDKLLYLSRKFDLSISEIEEKNPYLLHSKLGAYYTEQKYGITNPDILNAIRYHTTGRPGMTLLEQIIFVADYMEPGRKQIPGLGEIRALAFENLEQCICQILENTIAYLKTVQKQKDIDPMTQLTLDYYKEKSKNDIH